MISPGRLWWLLRRDLQRGWSAAYHDYKTLPRIEEWSWPFWHETPQPVPLHLLTGANDWRLAAWMLASWFETSERTWSIVIHEDGTLPAAARETLTRLFPTARFISREEADPIMAKVLVSYPFCGEYRKMHPLALKIFDVPHFAAGPRFFVFDSDVLFFNHPREILDWAGADRPECWFNADVEDSSLITAAEAREELGVKLWQRVNSGLCLIHKPALELDFMDRALGQTSILRGKVWRIEQTLFALCASRHAQGGLLSPRYEVSLGKHAQPDAVARHYVGAVRQRFYAEGLERLRAQILPTPEKPAR